MRTLTGRTLTDMAWTQEPRPTAGTRRPRPFDLLSGLFAMVALATVAAPILMQQSSDSAASARATGAASSAVAPAGSEMMFAGYVGSPYTYSSDVHVKKSGIHDFTAADVSWQGKPFVNPIYYGARIVRWFESGRTGAMVDFTHSKTIAELDRQTSFTGTINGAPAPAKAALRDIFHKLEASHGHNMLTLNGLLRLPSLGSWLHPYVGIGAGAALPHSEVQLANQETRTYEYQYAGPVAQALIGVELRVARVSYFFEYKFTLASYEMPLSERDGVILFVDLWKQFQDWLSGKEPPGGTLTTKLISHQAIAGIGVRSAPATLAAP